MWRCSYVRIRYFSLCNFCCRIYCTYNNDAQSQTVKIVGFDDEAIELFKRMSKQKPDNWDILVHLRDNSHGELDKLPRAAVLGCKSKEEADALLDLIPE